MSIVVTDPALVQQLREAAGSIEVHDSSGNLLGTFAPPYGNLPPGVRSPFTAAEIERRRQEPDGRSLAEILGDLEKRS
jgi:hypothetical protein